MAAEGAPRRRQGRGAGRGADARRRLDGLARYLASRESERFDRLIYERVRAGPKGAFRQEIVYLGRSVGDPILYPPGEKERMLAEAKRLLFELAGQSPSQ
jgi:hypothetical protein